MPNAHYAHDLALNSRQAIAAAVNPLVADAFALFVKTKNYHWHILSPNYRDYHLLLDEQATQVFNMIDVLAERVRKLGQATVRSIGQITQWQHVKDDHESDVPAEKMLQRLLEDNKNFLTRLRAAHQVCSDHNDVGTTSVLENFIDEAEQRIWFLSSTL